MARISKPSCLGILPRPLRVGGWSQMVYGASLAFPLREANVLFAEPDTWQMLAPYLPQILAPDMGGAKGCGEWMLAGASFLGANAPQRSWEPDVRIGPLYKRLRVHGPRRWEQGSLSQALPVGCVAMDWRSAWGGTAVAENPVGCGVRDDSGAVSVPCIEDPEQPWTSPDESCQPACTLPLDMAHPLRRRFAGTYDAAYAERFFPGMPADFDHRFFNRAPLDQQMAAMWRGDETFVLRHWHAEHARIEGRLPGLRTALHVAMRGEPLQRVEMGLSTVWLFPNDLFGVLVFEGSVPVHTLDGSEIERVIAGLERLDTPALSVEHYERLWQMRTERTPKAAAFSMDDSNLCPPGIVTRFAALDSAMASSKRHPALEKMGERMARQWEQAIERLPKLPPEADQPSERAATTSLDGAMSPDLSAVVGGMRQMFVGMAELSRQKLDLQGKKPHEVIEATEQFQAETQHQLKVLTAEYGSLMQKFAAKPGESSGANESVATDLPTDPSGNTALVAKLAQRTPGEPLTLTAAERKALMDQLDAQSMKDGWDRLDGLIAQNIARGDLPDEMAQAKRGMERLRQQVAALGDSEADGAQRLVESVKAYASMPGAVAIPAQPRDGEDWHDYTQRWQKDAKRPQFEPLNDNDLLSPDVLCAPGLQLRNRTVGQWRLRGLDLRGAVLENTTFVGCDLRDCTLSNSVWINCTLIGCDLSGANLDKARVTKTKFQWCSLTGVLGAHSHWDSTQFVYGLATGSDWQHSQWTAGTAVETDFTDSNWSSSSFTRQVMLKVPFGHAQFLECHAARSTWIECRLEDTLWNGSILKGCYLSDTHAPKSWRNASLNQVSLRGTDLTNSVWKNAKLEDVDCGEAKLCDCDFTGVQANNVHMLNTDLRNSCWVASRITSGIFTGANLSGASFSDATLEHCWFGLALLDDLTDFTGADLLSSNFNPKQQARA